MRKPGLALLLTSSIVSGPVFAQSSITLYGIVDTGVEFITHATPTGGSVARLPVIGGGDVPSRWGLKGSEDLGGGLKAIFTLENGFAVSNGTALQANRLFGRQAYVGLSSTWGQLTFGRQYSMQTWGMIDANIMGAAGIGGVGSLDSALLADRFDNSLSYIGKFSGLTVGASYSFGRDASAAGNCGGQTGNDFLACRGLSAMLKYDASFWGVAATYEELRGGAGSAPIAVVPGARGAAFTQSGDTDRRYQLNAHLTTGPVRFGAGWIHRILHGDIRSAKTDIEYLGASLLYGAWVFDAQVSHISNSKDDANGTLSVVRANYNLSKRTAVYGVLGYMKNNGKGAIYSVSAGTAVPAARFAGSNQIGLEMGIRHTF
ncbi:porin [Paraburkholderia rhynchosiae]|uniref:Porin n=1 Tax=Paraburkholderia rhynchosiae TaxID=487049 RepID=A0A2N7W4D0_9BURK|nr:porin [Paraburkholderia rhynchosiae]PMS24242.1 porin [Paraburkholderia rhynchosiae]CAB3741273.1 Outer membrane porin protein [Paraburkholderia rhynchosiae]